METNGDFELDAGTEVGLVTDERGHPSEHDAAIHFPGCADPTLGVELELSLVDAKTGELVPRAPEVIEKFGDADRVKPELFQTIVELNTEVCPNVDAVAADLGGRLEKLHGVCGDMGMEILCTGTHPFSDWRELPITDGDRYHRLVDSMQWPARRLLICGVHVHVGTRSGEHAVALVNSLAVFLPHLLAVSGSSPYWAGRDTGLASARVKVFEGLPTAGLQPHVNNWGEFVSLMRTLMAAGSISSIREVWWDIRPHTGFGTVEVRICDGINTLTEICAVTAFVQCLVTYLQDRYDRGETMPMLRHWTLRENKWRAARFGLDARMIRNERGDQIPIDEHINEWVERLIPTAEQLGCRDHLELVNQILAVGPSYQRQRKMYEHYESFPGVVHALANELRNDEPWSLAALDAQG